MAIRVRAIRGNHYITIFAGFEPALLIDTSQIDKLIVALQKAKQVSEKSDIEWFEV